MSVGAATGRGIDGRRGDAARGDVPRGDVPRGDVFPPPKGFGGGGIPGDERRLTDGCDRVKGDSSSFSGVSGWSAAVKVELDLRELDRAASRARASSRAFSLVLLASVATVSPRLGEEAPIFRALASANIRFARSVFVSSTGESDEPLFRSSFFAFSRSIICAFRASLSVTADSSSSPSASSLSLSSALAFFAAAAALRRALASSRDEVSLRVFPSSLASEASFDFDSESRL